MKGSREMGYRPSTESANDDTRESDISIPPFDPVLGAALSKHVDGLQAISKRIENVQTKLTENVQIRDLYLPTKGGLLLRKRD
jgi:hypothetical protein